jgi:protease-4
LNIANFTPLATKIGIYTEQVKTHENAANCCLSVPLDENFSSYTEGV